jgi:hypothetical protein
MIAKRREKRGPWAMAFAFLLPMVAWGAMVIPPPPDTAKGTGYLLLNLPSLRLSFEYPKSWLLDDSDADRLHVVQLYGPWRRSVDHPMIALFHYGPDSLYPSQESYIRKRLSAGRNRPGEDESKITSREITVAGRRARLFTLSFIDTFGAYSTGSHREPARETVVLLDAPQGGFFVFQYHAAQAIFANYYPAFERLLSTAKFPKT